MSIVETLSSYLKKLYDINGSGELESNSVKDGVTYNEVGIFNESLSSYNEQTQTIEIFEDSRWVEKKLDEVVKQNSRHSEEKQDLSNILPQQTENSTCASTCGPYTVKVNTEVFGKEVEFTYDRTFLEHYVINDLKEHSGKKIEYYSEIPNIRAKAPEERTDRENRLLEEFDNMINWIIESGKDYGVDPKKILAIIEDENACRGINYDANGKLRNKYPDRTFHNPNGNGYMAITSVCIVDILGGQGTGVNSAKFQDCKNKETLKDIISKKYGSEMAELLENKGYNLNITKASEKKALAEKIWKIIWDNTDPEFNIRMGTLILRNKEFKTKGGDNFTIAAQNYNGHPTNKYDYARRVSGTYRDLYKSEKDFPQQNT